MTLDEIPNDITRKTPCSFEPTIDYVVAKIPKWQFEKFPGSDTTLTTQMKSVGEVMAIGRTFRKRCARRSARSSRVRRGARRRSDDRRCLREKLHVPGRTAFTGFLRRSSAACPRRSVRPHEDRSVVHPPVAGNARGR
jgi:hypothetical protein